MPSPININNITPPRVPLTDPRTGLISREWYRFFLSLFELTGSGQNPTSLEDLQKGPVTNQESLSEIQKDIIGSQLGPEYQDQSGNFAITLQQAELSTINNTSEVQAQLDIVRQELETVPRVELGTMASVQQDNCRLIGFSTVPSPAVPVPAPTGTLYWDGGTTLGLQMTQNVLQKVGESLYVYVKASSAITKGQVCVVTGAVGASGVITAAPAPLSSSVPYDIVGVAAESIALNNFGLIAVYGNVRGFNTSGTPYGETWADGDTLWYNPAYVGGLTNVEPVAPNQKTKMGEVVNAASGGSGDINVNIVYGSILGGTDSNVNFGILSGGDLIQYDSVNTYWKNVSPASVLASTWGAPVTKTANFTVAASETWLINNKSGSSCTVTLPSAASYSGRMLVFQNHQAQTLVSASSNVVPIGGGSAGTAILEAVAGNWATLVSDGTNWIVMQAAANNCLLTE